MRRLHRLGDDAPAGRARACRGRSARAAASRSPRACAARRSGGGRSGGRRTAARASARAGTAPRRPESRRRSRGSSRLRTTRTTPDRRGRGRRRRLRGSPTTTRRRASSRLLGRCRRAGNAGSPRPSEAGISVSINSQTTSVYGPMKSRRCVSSCSSEKQTSPSTTKHAVPAKILICWRSMPRERRKRTTSEPTDARMSTEGAHATSLRRQCPLPGTPIGLTYPAGTPVELTRDEDARDRHCRYDPCAQPEGPAPAT